MRSHSKWVVGGLTLLALALSACKKTERNQPGPAAPPEERFLVVAQEQQASWVRNFNPLLSPSSIRWPTPAGIYEPMMIYNTLKGEYVPWLAESRRFNEDNTSLEFQTRSGVKWSDGKPFSAKDVAFTFQLMKTHAALDQHAMWKVLESVEAPTESTVVFRFAKVFTPGLFRIAQQPIVPEHVWSKIDDPVTFSNPDPIATGPFTVVKTFQNQVYELGKNPNYWQAGKPYIAGLRFPAFPSNEPAALALMNGEVDWSGKFIPDIEKVYVAKDPEHHKFWFPNLGTTHNVYTNTTRAPLSDVRVRKALSMAIDRERVTKIAVYGYTKPIRPHGLSRAFDEWANPSALEDADWVSHSPEKANQLLDQAGLAKGPDGMRLGPDGKALQLTFNVVTGWSDWISAVQLIIRDFAAVGVKAEMKTLAFSAYFDALQRGDYDLSMGWAEEGPTPYMYYRFVMSGVMTKPVGEAAPMNWNRFQNDEVDAALSAFERTRDPKEQRALSDKLQALYSKHAPLIPLHPSPSWGICNTSRFTGFPSEEDPYARLSPFSAPEYLLVLTNVKPREMPGN
jgi:peptide/nickel transport system substrate-binding protein